MNLTTFTFIYFFLSGFTAVRILECVTLIFYFCIWIEALYVTVMRENWTENKRRWQRVCTEAVLNGKMITIPKEGVI